MIVFQWIGIWVSVGFVIMFSMFFYFLFHLEKDSDVKFKDLIVKGACHETLIGYCGFAIVGVTSVVLWPVLVVIRMIALINGSCFKPN
ncbi:MAG: hypothetical protein ACRDC6_16535 [Shewanella sp.]